MKQLLKQIIEKAIEGGYKGNQFIMQGDYEIIKTPAAQVFHSKTFIRAGWDISIDEFVLSHDFAKAYFGEETDVIGKWEEHEGSRELENFVTLRRMPEWEYRLQMLVLSEDKLAYLKRFL